MTTFHKLKKLKEIDPTLMSKPYAHVYTMKKTYAKRFKKISIKLYEELRSQDTSCTVKPVLSRHSKIDKTKVFKTNDSLMNVKSI